MTDRNDDDIYAGLITWNVLEVSATIQCPICGLSVLSDTMVEAKELFDQHHLCPPSGESRGVESE
jgi:hypothetical protein